jgi:hypothetical protein
LTKRQSKPQRTLPNRSHASDKASMIGLGIYWDILEEDHTYKGRTQRTVGELNPKTLIDRE